MRAVPTITKGIAFLLCLFTIAALATVLVCYHLLEASSTNIDLLEVGRDQQTVAGHLGRFVLQAREDPKGSRSKIAEIVRDFDGGLRVLQYGGGYGGYVLPAPPAEIRGAVGLVAGAWTQCRPILVRLSRETSAEVLTPAAWTELSTGLDELRSATQALLGKLSDRQLSIRKNTMSSLFLMAAADVLLLFLGVWLTHYGIHRPLRDIARAVQRMRAGNFDQAVHVKSVDEIDDLARAITETCAERRRVEAELRASEDRYRLLVDLSPDVIAVHSEGKLVFINDAGVRLLGAPSPQELIGRPVLDFVPPDCPEIVKERVQRIGAGEVVPLIQEKFLGLDGSPIDVEVAAISCRYHEKPAVLVVARDITERVRAEQALRESETLLRTIIQSEPECVKLVDLDGCVLEMNSAGLAMIEADSLDQVKGRRVVDLVAPHDRAAFQALSARVFAGDSGTLRFEIVGLKGDQRWMETHAVPLRNADGEVTALLGLTRDITERKRTEEAARESEEKYRILVDNIQDGVFIIQDGEMLFVNEAFARMVGYLVEEVIGMDFRRLVAPEDLEMVADRYRRRQAGQDVPREYEFRMLHKDGNTRIFVNMTVGLVDYRGRVASLGTVKDVTERRRAVEALREGERHYRELFEAHPIPMCIYDPASLQILAVNPAASRTYGWSREELARLTLRDLWSPEETDLLESHMVEVRRDVRAILTGESWHQRRKDGTIIEVEINAGPVSWEGRQARAFTAQDVTERRRIEDQLRQSQKLEAVGLLAGGIAHDFNNIMQAMLSLATVLRLRATSPELATTVSEIEAHIKRGASLTQQLLLFSSRQFSQRTPLDLGEITNQAGTMLRHLIPENIHIDFDLSPERLSFDGDAMQIQQVLMNLTVNARDAMPSGGAIFLRTGRQNGEVWVEVADHGSGMTPEVQERIFEPFFTTKQAGHGTGLGLSVVHGIIGQHGGRIDVASQPGQGSRFRVLLPETGPPDAVPVATAREDELPRGNGERILIVEDESGAREGLEQIVTLLGYTVMAMGSGEAALALPCEPEFDLLLTDLMLPGVDGPTLAKLLRERWPQLRAILMSGYTEDESVRRAVKNGAMRFLQKPFDIASFAYALHATLAG